MTGENESPRTGIAESVNENADRDLGDREYLEGHKEEGYKEEEYIEIDGVLMPRADAKAAASPRAGAAPETAPGDAPKKDKKNALSPETLRRALKLAAKGAAAVAAIAAVVAIGAAIYRYRTVELPASLIREAAESFERGEWEDAEEKYARAEKILGTLAGSPEGASPDIISRRRAEAFDRRGMPEEAVIYYDAYIASLAACGLSPDRGAELASGFALIRLGRSDDALPRFERAVTLEREDGDEPASGDAELRLLMAEIYESKSEDKRAADIYAAYLASDGEEDAERLLEIGRKMMKLNRYKDALAGFTRANDLLASDDKRGFHAMNAAKNMLGWPTDEAMVMTPGQSIGNMRLGMTRAEALEAWGTPKHRFDDDGYSIWSYSGSGKAIDITVYLDGDEVIEIVTELPNHSTSDGLSLGNFRHEKFAPRFEIARDTSTGTVITRYALGEGGLAFYDGSPDTSGGAKAVIYGGPSPLTEHIGAEWVRDGEPEDGDLLPVSDDTGPVSGDTSPVSGDTPPVSADVTPPASGDLPSPLSVQPLSPDAPPAASPGAK